jgi:exopolyphosphatase/guanosine-5'-triphosphate,3'-diphosphate pyrophosphatase
VCTLLRLAVVLHRGRSSEPLPPITLQVDRQRLHLLFPAGWLAAHPLTRADLQIEAAMLARAGFALRWGDAKGSHGQVPPPTSA